MNEKWRDVVRAFRRDEVFWYFPHATIDPARVRAQISIFQAFDGIVWSDDEVNRRLRGGGLTAGSPAGTRMLRKALENAGLCWLDDHILRITPAGYELIAGKNPVDILERLLWRYELSTPINNPGPLCLFPHPTLLDILIQVGGRVTRDEFTLFVGRTTTSDVTDTVRLIRDWRLATPLVKNEVLQSCGEYLSRRARDAGYCMSFHASASYLERFPDENHRIGIRLIPRNSESLRLRLETHTAGSEWLHYATTADCVASYGAAETGQDLVEAVDHYLDTSQFDKAVEAFRRLPPNVRGGKSVEDFEKDVFLEKDLEDFLSQNLGLIETGLVLEGKGRQHPTTIGTMDLFARAANGDLVVVELKKVRASDKVFGQICRYIGWVKLKYEGGDEPVRGYIIGSEIDPKLQFAASVIGEPTIRLRRFRRGNGEPAIWMDDPIPEP